MECDFETRSPVSLREHGAYVYFEHPEARVLLGSFLIDGAMLRWRFGEPCPAAVRAQVEAGAIIKAHNASFEALCFDWLADNCGWPRPALEQFVCTATTAAALQLPRALDLLGDALQLDVRKDKDGARLMRMFSIPDKNGRFTEPDEAPDEFDRYHAYCDRDVEAEVAADARMVPLPAAEQAVYTLSERINRRGVRIDVESAQAALRLADAARRGLDQRLAKITGGTVRKCTEVAKLTQWATEQGAGLASLAKADLDDVLLAPDLPSHVREALETRQEAAKSSVMKIDTMLARASRDGRVRGGFIQHGAGTGRWSSVGVNWANLPRPRREYEDAHVRPDALFAAIRTGSPEYLQMLYGGDLGRPLHLLSDAIRGFIWAAPGHDLVQADYSNIEGSVNPWLAGEEWKLEAIREVFADPSLPDMYRRTAASILSLPIGEVTKKHWARQGVGKPAELGLGYQGGVNAFYTFARVYGVDLAAIAPPVLERADEEALERAARRYEFNFKSGRARARELGRDPWMACEIIKIGWRAQNAAIAASWGDLEAAARGAVADTGSIHEAARVKYLHSFGYLWALLPSGRCLAYGAPRLRDQVWAQMLVDGEWLDAEVMDRATAERLETRGEARIKSEAGRAVTAMSVDAKTKKWRRRGLYGGLLCENNTQAVARDILVNGMWKAEAAGYPIVAHVYDEIICEVPRGFGDLAEFERLICETPQWAAGLPVSAGGWRGKRYRKE